MKLLQQLLEMSKARNADKPATRNFVAKHAQSTGAGRHVDKKGKNAPRDRQKQQWKKEAYL